jgi:hypothetical protein
MIPSGICEVRVLIAGRTRLTIQMADRNLSRAAMLIAEYMPDLEQMGRVAVVVTTPDLVRRIICRSR